MNLVRKKSIEQIDRSALKEFSMTEDQLKGFREGVEFFNQSKYWEAHEVWEHVWRQIPDESRIFFQGMIQAAAGYYRVKEYPSYVGALNNFEKAFTKLEPFPDRFLGVNVEGLRRAIVQSFEEVKRLGPGKLTEFPGKLFTKLEVS